MYHLELVVSLSYTSCQLQSMDDLSNLESGLHLETGKVLVAVEIDVLGRQQQEHYSREILGIAIVDLEILVAAVPCIQASDL